MNHATRTIAFMMLASCAAACGGSTSPTSPPASGGGTTTPPPPPPPPPPPTPTGYGASLVPSSAAPAVGDNVTISVVVNRNGGAKVGSFLGSVSYDATSLQFVSGSGPGSDMVLVNSPTAGLVRVVGASVTGIGSDSIAAIKMQVLKTGGLASLKLTMSEVTTVAFDNQTPSGDASPNGQVAASRAPAPAPSSRARR